MNFDDTASFLGPSQKLSPEVFNGLAGEQPEKVRGKTDCLMCSHPMVYEDGQLNCKQCPFFYKPFGGRKTLPEKYWKVKNARSMRLCTGCREVTVGGCRRLCGKCAHQRKLASTRATKRNVSYRKKNTCANTSGSIA